MNKISLLVRKLQLREHDELKIIIRKFSSKNVDFFSKINFGGIPPFLKKSHIFLKNPKFFQEI